MKKLAKIDIIELIGKELQKRMTYTEIDNYFKSYNIPTNHNPTYNSKRIYVKEILPNIDDEIILEIAKELEIQHPEIEDSAQNIMDLSFWKPGYFKLFISHLASFKQTVGHLKKELEKYGISAFVAHEDIEPTKEWIEEIEKALFSMEAFCVVLMPDIKKSDWIEQEIGAAIGRNILIIPIHKGLDPYGFIGKYQALQSKNKNIGEVAENIFNIISKHSKTKLQYLNVILELILLSNTAEEGTKLLDILNKIPNVSREKIAILRKRVIENKNLQNFSFLKTFNKLMDSYNIEAVQLEEFQQKVYEDKEDLPF